MADATLLPVGSPFVGNGRATFVNNFALNQANDKVAYVWRAPEAITITRLGVRSGTLTGTSPTYKISLQGVAAASGAPDGTVLGGASPAEKTFAVAASNTWAWRTLDNAYTCARGDLLAVVVEYSSGTIDGSNNSTFTVSWTSAGFPWMSPYWLTNDNAAGWTKSGSSTGPPAFGVGSATKAYGYPFSAAVGSGVNTGTTPDEVGMLFTLPAGWGDTFQVAGVRLTSGVNAGTTGTVKLYDSDGSTVLQSVQIDTDTLNTGVSGSTIDVLFDEATLSTLSFGTAYRVTLTPDAATSWFPTGFDVAAAADWDAYVLGQNVKATHRTDAGAWTDTATRRYYWDLLLADWTEPAGGVSGPVADTIFIGGGIF